MNVPPEIPLLRVSGSYRGVGRQIGEACAGALQQAADFSSGAVPRFGRTVDELLAAADRCRAVTGHAFPWLLEELDGAAEGAGVDPRLLFAASVEELWESRPSQPGQPPARTQGRCTDVLVPPAFTGSGHLLVAHNNDLSAPSQADVVAIERDVPGDPVIFSLGIGPWISVGWNSAGVSLTGNEVSPNDERDGIPRLLLVRAQLRARTLAEAVDLTLHPRRGSAYNTVLADSRGGAVNVEASATDSESWGPQPGGGPARNTAGPAGTPHGGPDAIIHTNHYLSGRMAAYEGDPAYAVRSARRSGRASELLAELGDKPVDERALLSILSDHVGGQDAICRHPAEGEEDGTKTVFWCVTDVTARRVSYGAGNPCRSSPQSYAFS